MAIAERFSGANSIDAGRLSPYWGEHVARYRLAEPLVGGLAIMDIACGTGYGVGVLRSSARSVVGIDLDATALAEARAECGDNASVLMADGLRLPFDDEAFDAVTSFETLEHLHERPAFLAELRRVIKPGGMLILSTPNALYSQPLDGKPTNPFHVFEYTPDELRTELGGVFEIERFVGQLLDPATGIPPFYDAQQRLPRDVVTQAKLFGWKVMNKLPLGIREPLSDAIWRKPFYPTEADYLFDESHVDTAQTLVAICRKR